jgi:hypothetical protein
MSTRGRAVTGWAACVAAVAGLLSSLSIGAGTSSASLGVPVPPGGSVCPGAVGEPGAVAVLNLTPVEATAAGFGAVRASDAPSNNSLGVQAVSNVNFRPGSVDPNVALASIGSDHRVCFDNSPHASIHLVADQMGVMPASAYQPAAATGAKRLVDTRSGPAVAPGASVCAVAVGAPGRIAVVNITPVEATGPGFGAVRASDAPSNNTLGEAAVSNANFSVGSIDPNLAFTEIGGDGRICFDNSPHSATHVIIDQMGSLPDSAFVPAAASGATRLMDTRRGLVVGGIGVGSVVPGAAVCAEAVGNPGDVAVVNGTPVEATAAGFMAVRASDAPSNNTLGANAVSNWNFAPGSVDPNVAFAEIGPDGMICIDNSNHATVQMVLDQAGYLPAGAFTPASASGAARIVDTRTGFVAEPGPAPPTTITTTTTIIATTTTTSPPSGATAPGAPLALTGTAGPGRVTLNWSPPSSDGGAPIDTYRVERSVGDTSQWEVLGTTVATTHLDEYLDPDVVYFYRVSAHNAVGWGPSSDWTGHKPNRPGRPGRPVDLTILPGSTSLSVSWQPPATDGGAPIVGYYAQLRSGTCGGSLAVEVATATTSVAFHGLQTSDVYCVVVYARTDYSVGDPASATATVGAPAAPSPCTLSVDGYPTQAGGIQWDANVSWSTPVSSGASAITAYQARLYRDGNYYGAINAGPDDRYTTFQDVPPSGSYHAEVIAYNSRFSPTCVTATVSL